jgi:hypothetical protein
VRGLGHGKDISLTWDASRYPASSRRNGHVILLGFLPLLVQKLIKILNKKYFDVLHSSDTARTILIAEVVIIITLHNVVTIFINRK